MGTFQPVSEAELDVGLAHARKKYDARLDRDLLRRMVNTVLQRKKPSSVLPLLAATVVREFIPARTKEARIRIDGYKSAVMKICSDRSARSRQKLAAKIPTISCEPKEEYPADECGQYKLL